MVVPRRPEGNLARHLLGGLAAVVIAPQVGDFSPVPAALPAHGALVIALVRDHRQHSPDAVSTTAHHGHLGGRIAAGHGKIAATITATVLRGNLPDPSADWAAELAAHRDDAIQALVKLTATTPHGHPLAHFMHRPTATPAPEPSHR